MTFVETFMIIPVSKLTPPNNNLTSENRNTKVLFSPTKDRADTKHIFAPISLS